MTDTQPQDDATLKERLTAVETGLRHFQQICELRERQTDRQIREAFANVYSRDQKQDAELEAMEEWWQERFDRLHGLLWKGISGVSGLLAVTLLGIVLKALQLY